ncbi:MAG: hypothetical protein U0905_11590 [Pirellulales bacterium]
MGEKVSTSSHSRYDWQAATHSPMDARYLLLKVGISDEKRQYRELYRNDEEYLSISSILDWISSDPMRRRWQARPLVNRTPMVPQSLRSLPGGLLQRRVLTSLQRWTIANRYSKAIEDEGVLDDQAQFW